MRDCIRTVSGLVVTSMLYPANETHVIIAKVLERVPRLVLFGKATGGKTNTGAIYGTPSGVQASGLRV